MSEDPSHVGMQRDVSNLVTGSQLNQRAIQLTHLAISLTQECNLQCLHCYVDAGSALPREVSTEQVLSAIAEAVELGAESVSITGGEPFLRSDLHEIVRYAASRGCGVSIETNGTLLTDESLKRLKAVDRDVLLAVSLDGIKPMTHDHFRGTNGSFVLAVRALRTARALGFRLQVITIFQGATDHD